MSDRSKIAWCDASWNPIIGCSKISEGCDHCYAETMARRLGAMGRQEYLEVLTASHAPGNPFYKDGWNGKTTLIESRLEQPLGWKRPRRIFVCSMGDFYHQTVQLEWNVEVFRIIERCPHHTFMILTKRPGWMTEHLELRHAVPANAWLGVTVENQEWAVRRLPVLLRTPAVVRWVSLEPLLRPVDITRYLAEWTRKKVGDADYRQNIPALDWVVVGCESGPNRRPCPLAWVEGVVEQCREAAVPVFVKQINLNGRVSRDMTDWPEHLRVRQWPENHS